MEESATDRDEESGADGTAYRHHLDLAGGETAVEMAYSGGEGGGGGVDCIVGWEGGLLFAIVVY